MAARHCAIQQVGYLSISLLLAMKLTKENKKISIVILNFSIFLWSNTSLSLALMVSTRCG